MKCMSIAIATLCLALASTASAQTFCEEIGGGGTPNSIARFTGTCKVGNSNIFQAGSNVGVNTTSPQATLDVESTGISGILGTTSSTDLFAAGVIGRTVSPTGNGVVGEAAATSGINDGVLGRSASTSGIGVNGIATATTGNAYGVSGQTFTTDFGAGVIGSAAASTGHAFGVFGQTASPNGSGVSGVANATTGSGSAGVNGFGSATTGLVWGVIGAVDGNPVNTEAVGVQASGFNAFRAFSQTCPSLPCTPLAGTAGLFGVGAGGTILAGITGNPGIAVFRVDSTGKGFFNGGTQTGGADFAESVAVSQGPNHYGPGDLLVLDATADRQLTLANEPYSTLVAVIYSTKPGVLATTHNNMDGANFSNEVPLAIVGIVPCKVTAENGPIQRGDLLVTSSTPGHAMRGTDRARMLGAVVGKALEPLAEGKGVIQVLVTLQ